MHTTNLRIIILGLIFSLAFAGCGQRYWYRLKLDGSSVKRYTVKVNVVNHTPTLISDEFEEILKKGAFKELKKIGYYETPKDSPDFFLVLQLAVDSFNMVLYQEQKKIAMYSDSAVKDPNVYRFKKTVRAILMQCDLVQRKPLKRKWTAYEDIFYFNEYRRDMGRSESVVRYLIRSAEERSRLN